MKKEMKNLTDLVDIQHRLTRGLANLVDPWLKEDDEKRMMLHKYLIIYMDTVSGHVLENRITSISANMMKEIGEWTSTYKDDEIEEMFKNYHDVLEAFDEQDKEETEEEDE